MSSGNLFKDDRAQIELLRKRAYMRWNALPESVIPLTAADPDFPVAPEISTVIQEYARDGLMGYGVIDGVPGFQECMAQVAVEHYGIDCIPQQIIPIAGAAAGM
jgi:bifunctional pyridoxal-dependent enzyme with beta-cystathionase and maltose regulon repressor activities